MKTTLSLSWWRGFARLPGHTGSVNEVCFHPKEPIIASVASDRTGELRRTLLRSCWADPRNWRTDFCQNQEVLTNWTPLMYLNSARNTDLNSSYEIMDQHNYGPNDLAQQDGLHGRAGRLSCADPCSISMLKDVQKDLWLFLFSQQLNCKKVERTSIFKSYFVLVSDLWSLVWICSKCCWICSTSQLHWSCEWCVFHVRAQPVTPGVHCLNAERRAVPRAPRWKKMRRERMVPSGATYQQSTVEVPFCMKTFAKVFLPRMARYCIV